MGRCRGDVDIPRAVATGPPLPIQSAAPHRRSPSPSILGLVEDSRLCESVCVIGEHPSLWQLPTPR